MRWSWVTRWIMTCGGGGEGEVRVKWKDGEFLSTGGEYEMRK